MSTQRVRSPSAAITSVSHEWVIDDAHYVVREETWLSEEQRDAFGNAALDNFVHYAQFSTPRLVLFFVKVFRQGRFLGLSPVIKIIKNKSTNLLRASARRWAGPLLGPLSRKTTYMLDTAFMGFQYVTPIFCVDPAHEPSVRNCIFEHLKSKKEVDNIWIAEPAGDLTWAAQNGFESFDTLPSVQVRVAGYANIENYLASLSKKRRKNFRQDRRPFDQHGVTIDYFEPPLPPNLKADMHRCLVRSAENNAKHHDLVVPFEDLQIHRQAFLTQPQHSLVARVGEQVIGFFSFLPNGKIVVFEANATMRSHYPEFADSFPYLSKPAGAHVSAFQELIEAKAAK